MHFAVLVFLFCIVYAVQLVLCLKVKHKHIQRIPLYLCLLWLLYAALLYVEFFGHYSAGGWPQLEAIIYFILIGVGLLAILLAFITAKVMGKRGTKK